MGFHGFSVTVKEELSAPTPEDRQRELPDDSSVDITGKEWRLLRLRYMTRPPYDAESIAAAYLPHSHPDVEHMGSNSWHDTPRKVTVKTGISAVETEQRIFVENNRRFEPHFIELDAGEADSVMREIAALTTTGSKQKPLRRAYECFKNRRSTRPNGTGQEQHIQNLFCNLTNEVARELHSRKRGSYQDEHGTLRFFKKTHNVFLSKGSVYVKERPTEPDNHDPKSHEDQEHHTGWYNLPESAKLSRNKPDIFINVYQGKPNKTGQVLWADLPAAAEVKASAARDSRESLVLQIQRYQMNQIKCQASVGEIISLSLCDNILRGWATSCQRYGSTRGFSLDEANDHYDIVKLIALFSGPVQNYTPHWEPLPGPENALKMVSPEGQPFDLELLNVNLLDSRKDRFGRRTAVWSADAVDKYGTLPFPYDPKVEQLVIKGSWQIDKLCNHEHDVYEHIARREKELGLHRDPDINIPVVVGRLAKLDETGDDQQVVNANKPANVPLVSWRSRNTRIDTMVDGGEMEHAKYTVLVTKCFRARSIGQLRLNPLQVVVVYRKLFKILEYLAKLGIHYRDLSLGNVLVDADPVNPRCLLADFDFSRIEMRRRGSQETSDPLQTSLDDCVSGTRTFWSRHTEAGLRLSAELSQTTAQLRSDERELAEANAAVPPDINSIETLKESVLDLTEKKKSLEKDLARSQHRYIDDLESALYTMVYYAATLARDSNVGASELLNKMSIPELKENLWNKLYPPVKAIGFSDHWASSVADLRRAIKSAQDTVRSTPAQVLLHEAEKACYAACQEAFVQAETTLRVEAVAIPTSFQITTGLTNDPNHPGPSLTARKGTCSGSVAGHESDSSQDKLNENHQQAKRRRIGPANRKNDQSKGKGRAQANPHATDMVPEVKAPARRSPYPLRQSGPVPDYTK